MELRHLRYFVAVCDAMSFRKAAEALHISQPPLSQQIKALEEELGVPLFVREKQRIRLTAAGAAFRERALDILAQAHEAAALARQIDGGVTGTLDIHFISSAVTGTLQRIVAAYKKQYPGIRIRLSQSTMNRITADVESGTVDIGFVRLPLPPATGLTVKVALQESYVVALPAGHGLAKKKILTPADLRGEGMIICPRETAPGLYDDTLALFHAANIAPAIVQEAPEQLTIAGLVAAGMGYSVVPECMTAVKIPGLVHRPLRGGRNRTGIAVIAPAPAPAPAVARFMAMI